MLTKMTIYGLVLKFNPSHIHHHLLAIIKCLFFVINASHTNNAQIVLTFTTVVAALYGWTLTWGIQLSNITTFKCVYILSDLI